MSKVIRNWFYKETHYNIISVENAESYTLEISAYHAIFCR